MFAWEINPRRARAPAVRTGVSAAHRPQARIARGATPANCLGRNPQPQRHIWFFLASKEKERRKAPMFAKGVSRRWLVNTIGVVLFDSGHLHHHHLRDGAKLHLQRHRAGLDRPLGRAAQLALLQRHLDQHLLWLYRRGAGLYREVPRQEQHGDYGPGPKRPGVYHLHRL